MEILSAKYLISNQNSDSCPAPDRPEIAFIGRSNVGKSSLINMLTRHGHLAKTSATPGKTQLINHFEIKSRIKGNPTQAQWYLVDLPGYGYAKVSQQNRRQWENMIAHYLRTRKNLIQVCVLVDIRIPPQKLDLDFIDQLGIWGVPFCVVFTKADKEKPGAVKRRMEEFGAKMLERWQFLPAFFVTSASSVMGREEVLAHFGSLINNPDR